MAAQITELDFDQQSALGTAALLETYAKDPKHAATAPQLETYRQKELTQAASDGVKIAALLSSSNGKPLADGGADQVLVSIVAQNFAAQAQAFLNAGAEASAHGGPGPTSEAISEFLQEEMIVAADQGHGGHDVAGHAVARALLKDASAETLISPEGGVP